MDKKIVLFIILAILILLTIAGISLYLTFGEEVFMGMLGNKNEVLESVTVSDVFLELDEIFF